MAKQIINCIKLLVIGLLIIPSAALANTVELDKAVKAYYAGHPSKAIEMVKPLARSGDVAAQVLLANILYSLSQARHISANDEAIDWYKKAAMQSSAEANNALGVIYYNLWLASRLKQDAAQALSYYEKAIGLGAKVKNEPLTKLKRLSGVSPDKGTILEKETQDDEKLTQPSMSKPESQNIIPKPIVDTDFDAVIEKPEPSVELPGPMTETPEIAVEDPEPAVNITQLLADESEAADQEMVILNERPLSTLELKEIAVECGKYTQTGFNDYARSIKGAVAVGNAKVQNIDSSFLRLIMNKTDVRVLLNLKGVPQKRLRDLQPGDSFAVNGIILQSQLADSGCNIHLQFSPGTS